MERFGFSTEPPLDYPRDQMRRAASYARRPATCSTQTTGVDVGRVAIGQERLQVTPLQMALVAAAVATAAS